MEPAKMVLILKRPLTFCLSAIIILGLTLSAFAQSPTREGVESRQTKIATISKSLESNETNILEARDALRLIRTEARSSIEALGKEEVDFQTQLTSLGDVPEDGKVEPSEILERRTSLTKQIQNINALIAQARLNETDSNRLLETLSKSQRSSFMSETFKLQQSAFSPRQWKEIGTSFISLSKKMPLHYAKWKSTRQDEGVWTSDIFRILGMFIFLTLLLWPLRLWVKRLFSVRLNGEIPSDTERYIALGLHIGVRVIPAAIALLLLYQSLISTSLISSSYAPSIRFMIYATLMALLADGLAVGLFNTSQPNWRIIPLENKAAKKARGLSVSAVILLGIGGTITSLSKISFEFSSLANAATILMAIGIAALAFIGSVLVQWRLLDDRKEDISELTQKRWAIVKKTGMPLIIVILAALTLGYLNFAYFISVRMVLLLGLFVWVWVIRRYAINALGVFDQNVLAKQANTKPSSRQSILFWAGLVLDGVILLSLIPILLLVFGAEVYSVRTGLIDAFTGITIGNYTLSIADILAAITTFLVILFVTRFLQRTLDVRFFEKSGADIGFRNSFRTLLGYTGLIIAIFAAIGVIGLDLSNLAIIAGALSVGIGFGLQSIVNNFVSGLILLFERPVKVGDWVVTTSGEGVVKQISVRSTEIETFDRASIIVPNSELISSSVTNWTHKNKMGRVVIPVGVAYESDAKHVRKILLEIAEENERILKTPAPFVYFKEFGDSSLDLELRAFVENISEGPIVKNDLRFEILDKFRKESIEIPFPQRDVNLIK